MSPSTSQRSSEVRLFFAALFAVSAWACDGATSSEADAGVQDSFADDITIETMHADAEVDSAVEAALDAGVDGDDSSVDGDAPATPSCILPNPVGGLCEPTCDDDSDCSPEKTCVNVRFGCLEIENCPGLDVGMCIPRSTPQCTSGSEVCGEQCRGHRGDATGALCESQEDCPDGETCGGDGRCYTLSYCVPTTTCPDWYDPTCAFDSNITYPNECYARAAERESALFPGHECTTSCGADGTGACPDNHSCVYQPRDRSYFCRQNCELPTDCPQIRAACMDGACYPDPGPVRIPPACERISHMTEATCHPSCLGDADCSDGQICAIRRFGCPDGANCPGSWAGLCVDAGSTRCGSDSDCGAANYCVGHSASEFCPFEECIEPLYCSSSDDCADNGVCANDRPFRDPSGFTSPLCYPDAVCVPEFACPDFYAPVCGLSPRVTYHNECFARAANSGLVFPGECQVGCQEDTDCGDDEICQIAPGATSGICRTFCFTPSDCPYFSSQCNGNTCSPLPDPRYG